MRAGAQGESAINSIATPVFTADGTPSSIGGRVEESSQCRYRALESSGETAHSNSATQLSSSPSHGITTIPTKDDSSRDVKEQTSEHPRESSARIKLSAVFINLLKDALALHDEILGKRIALENERRNHHHQKEHTDLAQIQFMEASSNFVAKAASGSNSDPLTSLQERWEQLKRSTENLKSLEDRILRLEVELQKKEGRTFDKETLLYEEIRRGREDIRSSIASNDDLADSSSALISAHSGSSENSDDPHVRRYYDLLGDVRLFRERMFNFESKQQHEMSIREEQKELGQTVNPPDSQFYAAYFSRREYLIRELSTATADMRRAKSYCDHEGLSVEEPDLPPLADANALDHSHRVPRSVIQNAILPGFVTGWLKADAMLLFGDTDKKVRVDRWLSDVQKAARVDSFELFVPESESSAGMSPESKAITEDISQWTEREAADLLPFPDYGLLSPSPPLPDPQNTYSRISFQPDPPRRRYSEPSAQVETFDALCKPGLELESPKSVG